MKRQRSTAITFEIAALFAGARAIAGETREANPHIGGRNGSPNAAAVKAARNREKHIVTAFHSDILPFPAT